MRKGKATYKKQQRLRISALLALSVFPAVAISAEDNAQTYEFNNGFIVGSKENVDLKRFNLSAITEGGYSVDVYTNDEWKGRYELNVKRGENNRLGVCYTAEMLSQFGVDVQKLSQDNARSTDFCGQLAQWRQDEHVKDNFDASALRLDLYVPQIYENRLYKGYIAPEFWDPGVPAINLAYISNYYHSHNSDHASSDSSSAYLGLNAGMSYQGWLLKHIGNVSWQQNQNARWNSHQTYLQRPVASIKSMFTGGQFYTEGEFFDSVGLRGVSMKTDDNMYPDGIRAYAPEIRGVAMSNALVTVSQNGSVIYQTPVAPGPFNLTDIYPSGYGNDLEVTVKEADGSLHRFTVPYASVTQLLRPGMSRYQLAAGQADGDNLRNKPTLVQGYYQYGLSNFLTGYAGITGFNDYQSYLLGSGINTGIGALSLDMTQSSTQLQEGKKSGQSYRLSFNRMFSSTQTNIVLAAYRYSTKDYYNLNDALYSIDNERRENQQQLYRERNGFSYTLNQNLPEGWGGFYFNGRISSYWNRPGTEKQYQLSYNNNWNRLNYAFSAQRIYGKNIGGRGSDDRLSLNLSYPLYFGEKRSANLTANSGFANSRFNSAQIGLNGALGDDNNLTYGVSESVARGGNHNVALNGGYRSRFSTLSANYSQGRGYRQSGFGANGSLVLHGGGVTLSPETGSTLALIEAKNAEGASLPGSPGSRIDSQGYALLPYLRPYRTNRVEIDPKGSADGVVFDKTQVEVVPYEGSIVKVKFATRIEKQRVVHVSRQDGKPLPFGASVKNADGQDIGVVGQGSVLFLTEDTTQQAFVQWDNTQCRIDISRLETQEALCL